MKQELKQLADIQSGKILGNLSGTTANIQEISLGDGFTFSGNTLSVDVFQGSFTFSNGSGTTFNDDKVDLGGTLTQNTIIQGNTYSLSLGLTSSRLNSVNINAIQNTENYLSGSDELTIIKNPGVNSSDFNKEAINGKRSKVDQTLDTINLRVGENSGLDKAEIIMSYNEINLLTRTNGGTPSGIIIDELNGLKITNSINGEGIVYEDNYSANYINRSLVDKEYVDNAIIGASTFSVDYIDFNTSYTPTQQEGRLHWDADYGTLDLYLEGNNINLKVGLDNLYYIKNQTGSTINKGSVVRAVGTLGSSGRILGGLMIANGSVPHYYTLGIAGENIPDGEDGYVYEFGLIRGLNTSGTPYGETWVDGDILYVSSTISGGLTKVEPIEPNLKIQMAIVIKANNTNGSIFVRPGLGYNLGDLHNVQKSGAANGDILSFNQTASHWQYTKDLDGDYTISGTLSATAYYGDGSNLTGISANNFANSDLTLTGNRIHDLNGNALNFNNGATEVFRINTFNDVIARGKGDTTNTHFGLNVLRSNSTGVQNTIYGQDISGITSGQVNSYFGFRAGRFNNGTGNTFMGGFAGLDLTTGHNNVIIGRSAAFTTNGGATVSNLENSIVIGETARVLNSGDTNTIIIGRNSRGYGSNTVALGNSDITLTRLRGRVEMNQITSVPTITDNSSYAIWFNSGDPTIRLKNSGGVESNISLGIERVTTIEMNAIASPGNNRIVLNTDLGALYRYNGSAWVSLASGYGIIEVQSGTGTGQPTYFADLQSALETCKASGGYFTVKLYSNLTITSAIQIDYTGSGIGFAYLFRNLTIDFNGFNITNAQANTTDVFTIKLSNSASVYQNITFVNGSVFRTNGTGTHHTLKCDETGRFGTIKMSNMYWYCQNGQTARIGLGLSTAVDADRVCDLGNSVFISNASAARTMTLPNAATTVINFKAIHTGASDALYMDTGRAHNFYAENTSSGKAILAVGSNFIISNFNCKSNSGIALDLNGTNTEAHNFTAKSTSGEAVSVKGVALATMFKCDTGNNHALRVEGNSVVKNAFAQNNSATLAAVTATDYNRLQEVEGINLGASFGGRIQQSVALRGALRGCSFTSIGGIGAEIISTTNNINADNCNFESQLDTSGGHALRVQSISSGTFTITKCNFTIRNSGANALNASGATTVRVALNIHNQVATTPINANVTPVAIGF